jgi:hypothetical protein
MAAVALWCNEAGNFRQLVRFLDSAVHRAWKYEIVRFYWILGHLVPLWFKKCVGDRLPNKTLWNFKFCLLLERETPNERDSLEDIGVHGSVVMTWDETECTTLLWLRYGPMAGCCARL